MSCLDASVSVLLDDTDAPRSDGLQRGRAIGRGHGRYTLTDSQKHPADLQRPRIIFIVERNECFDELEE